MESCRFDGKPIPDAAEMTPWQEDQWCSAECCFRFYTFRRPGNEREVAERNRAMEEIIEGYRGALVIPREAQEDPGEEYVPPPSKTRLVLEVLEGEIQRAWADGGATEILIAEHEHVGQKTVIRLPRGKSPGPAVSPYILSTMEIEIDPAFVAETFRRAENA